MFHKEKFCLSGDIYYIFWISSDVKPFKEHFINIVMIYYCLLLFSFYYTLNHNFVTTQRFGGNSSKPFNQELNKFYFTETCQIGKPFRSPFKIYFSHDKWFISWKENFRCAKVSFFSIFFNFFILTLKSYKNKLNTF